MIVKFPLQLAHQHIMHTAKSFRVTGFLAAGFMYCVDRDGLWFVRGMHILALFISCQLCSYYIIGVLVCPLICCS